MQEEVLAKQLEHKLMEIEHEDNLVECNRLNGLEIQLEFPTLNLPPPTPITGIHFPSHKLGIIAKEEEVLDHSRLTSGQVQCKIIHERCICLAKNPGNPISIIT